MKIPVLCVLCSSIKPTSSIITNASIAYSFVGHGTKGELKFEHYFDWEQSHPKDIILNLELNLEQAFSGLEVDVTVPQVRFNGECPHEICKYCRGGKFMTYSSDHARGKLDMNSRLPCPVCQGTGMSAETCENFVERLEGVKHFIPPGARPGHRIVFHQQGNDIYSRDRVERGDFVIAIASVKTGDFEVQQNAVLYKLGITALEAINGFDRNVNYIDDQIISVNRTGKITLPGEFVTLKGLGLPAPPDLTTRDDLVISFALIDDEKEELDDSNRSTTIQSITTQGELDEMLARQERKRKNAAAKSLLRFLQKAKSIEKAS